MNPSGTSNRTFDGHIEPMRQPHLNLIDATQALHLGPNPASVLGGRLSADAHEFVPFVPAAAGGGAPTATTFYPQPVYPANNYQATNRFAGQPHQQQAQFQPQHRQNIQPYAGGGGGGIPYGGGHQQQHHPQQQRLPSAALSVQNRLGNNSTLDGNPNMFQGLPQQQQPYHHVAAQQQHLIQQQQQLMHSGGGGRFNNSNNGHHHHNNHHHNHQNNNNNHHHLGGGRRNNMGPPTANATGGGSGARDGGSGNSDEQSQEEVHALEMLRETIQQLTDKPGMFEDYAMDLKEAFGDVIESRFVMSCAIEMLFEQSIMEPQCRYMGARLCHLLDTLATTSVTSTNLFRELMILKLAHDETELPLSMQSAQLKVRGTALFLSDLYVQLNSDGAEQRIIELARSILCTMELLLSKPGPENAKCVCQALKLCGYQLEQDVGQDIETVMGMLAKLEHELDTSSSRLIESVLKLRMSRWGRNNLGSNKSSSSNYKPFNDGPVFYGPDGQVLTEDEASFLNAHSISSTFMNGGAMGGNLAAGDAAGYVANLDPDDLNAEMDPMVQEAYRQFLRQSNH